MGHLLRSRAPLRDRLKLFHKTAHGAVLWSSAAFHPDQHAFIAVNSMQLQMEVLTGNTDDATRAPIWGIMVRPTQTLMEGGRGLSRPAGPGVGMPNASIPSS